MSLRRLLTEHNSQWLERLSYATEGVLYEDSLMQIGIKAEYHGHLGRLAIFFGNKQATPIYSFSASIECSNPASLGVRFHDSPVQEIQALAQVQELVHVECKDVFTDPPILRAIYRTEIGSEGPSKALVLRLPVFLSRFVEGVTLEQGPFFERWKIIGGAQGVHCVGKGAKVSFRSTSRSAADLPHQTDDDG